MDSATEPLDEPCSFSARVDGNILSVIPSGIERLESLLSHIKCAQHSVTLITYTFAADKSGHAVLSALVDAALREVAVRLIVDDFGSTKTHDDFFAPLRAAGGSVQRFGMGRTRRYLVRNHQKLIIIDGKTAIIGGFNIADPYFAAHYDPNGWCDLGLIIEGPVVDTCQRWCDGLLAWMAQPRQSWRRLSRLIRAFHADGEAVSLVVGGPTPRLSPWARQLRHDLSLGRSVTAAMAYFSPNAGFLRRLAGVAARTSATLILPASSDNAATVGASRLLYGYLLKHGVQINEYTASLLHAKIAVIDNIVYIGSANFDMRSLYVNVELMLRVDDARFAVQCRDFITSLAQESTPITTELHNKRAGWLNRLRWALSWLMVGVIDYGVTRRLNFGLPKRK